MGGAVGCRDGVYYSVTGGGDGRDRDGLLVLLVPFDFFHGDDARLMRKKITDVAHIVGMIELPESMFNTAMGNRAKSILILRKNGVHEYVEEVLMAKLPTFEDPDKLQASLTRIDMWFDKVYGGNNYENISD